ncbi:hybrid sensor histidine kinase/response regulator [Melittangium boletus]|uniref:histidine kinase n=1 Tax=Melittangium boletus DSM 14713 TaxID=1294270 RepID=A0A250IHC8_9BACT|nr:ATP-binding protein [Melittangium boletus]ATB30571.1 hybrid sensor histidine kinase/response regulator [Melittangium boletus DSM 14713]
MSAGNDVSTPSASRPEAHGDALLSALAEVERSSPDGCLVLRSIRDEAGALVDFEWVFLNATAERMTDQLCGARLGLRFLDRSVSTRTQAHFAVFRQVVETGQSCVLELWAEGNARWLRLSLHRFQDGLVARYQDISPNKQGRLEAEALARRREGELDSAREQLMRTEKLSIAGQLAAGVGHEINNPLAFVAGNLHVALEQLTLVARDVEPSVAERLREPMLALEDARRGAERIRTIVKDLRTLARSDESRLGPVDVHAALEFSVSLAMTQVRHRARVERRYGEVPRVYANEAKLGQVFLNLIVNAAQAIPEGHAADHCITLVSRREGEQVVVEVRDTGMGMSPEVLSRVFEPFFTTKAQGEGLGLGLSICLGIVRSMKGELEAESEPGRGSVFRVSLSACEDETSAVLEPARTVADVQARKRVLVIDDEPAIGAVLRRILGRMHEVVVLHSGREALSLLGRDDGFDLVFCDLMMVDVSGMELHARLAPTHAELLSRFVYMTGGSFTDSARDFLKRIPTPRIDKPFEADVIRALVARAPPRRV